MTLLIAEVDHLELLRFPPALLLTWVLHCSSLTPSRVGLSSSLRSAMRVMITVFALMVTLLLCGAVSGALERERGSEGGKREGKEACCLALSAFRPHCNLVRREVCQRLPALQWHCRSSTPLLLALSSSIRAMDETLEKEAATAHC